MRSSRIRRPQRRQRIRTDSCPFTEGVAPPDVWRSEKPALIETVANRKSEVEFPILPTVRQLIIAAAEIPQLKTMPAAEWKSHVTTLANEIKK
jgi:hypothetical protein